MRVAVIVPNRLRIKPLSQETIAEIKSISSLSSEIVQLVLHPKSYIPYQAGQYLKIASENSWLSYSIAAAPLSSEDYELHIATRQDRASRPQFLEVNNRQKELALRLPFGQCTLNQLSQTKPLLFLAAGTGFAPIKALVEQLAFQKDPRPIHLYWGARNQSSLYMDADAKNWKNNLINFNYQSKISGQNNETLISWVLRNQPDDLNAFEIVISGPFDWVYATRDELIMQGIRKESLHSDAFAFEN